MTPDLYDAIFTGSEPASDVPTWRWLEQNVELSPVMTDLHGPISFEFFPASRAFFDHLDDPRLRKCTVMKCSQSAFTENAFMYLLRRIKERPTTTMWIGNNAEKTQEDAKKRIWPQIAACKAVQPLCPDESDRERWTSKLIMFDTMNLLIRGSNAVAGLRGDPCGLIICDERADWKPGRIEKARQRLSTKQAPVEVSIGAAGKKADELHADWLKGSQTFIYFRCPHCDHSQPFRFGREETTVFPEAREKGGVVWEENDVTRPGGKWIEAEFKKTVRYECEACGHRFENSDKAALLKTAHEHHRNPAALPENFSLHVSALFLIWAKRSWPDIAWEFITALDAMACGDIEPMIAFVQETLGEPWELRPRNKQRAEILDRCGDYKTGHVWADPAELERLEKDTVLILTFDRQQFELYFVVRQWRRNGQSRLVYLGTVPSYDELRAFQQEHKIKDRCMWGDDGGKLTTEFRQTCLRYGWGVLKGEDDAHFVFQNPDPKAEKKSWRQGWRGTEFDPGIGTVNQHRATMTAYLWSNPWFKDKLYNLFIVGKGPLWQIPGDVPPEYVRQITANDWREKERSNGQIEGYWHETGDDHFADCELEQLVVADMGGLTRFLPTPPTT